MDNLSEYEYIPLINPHSCVKSNSGLFRLGKYGILRLCLDSTLPHSIDTFLTVGNIPYLSVFASEFLYNDIDVIVSGNDVQIRSKEPSSSWAWTVIVTLPLILVTN